MKVFIDGQAADTDDRTEVSITLSVASQSKLEVSRTGYSKSIVLPMTARNRTLLGMPEDVNSVARFNSESHNARVEKDGCTVIEGVPCLAESVGGERGYYKFNIVGAGREWVRRASETPLRELGIAFNETFSAQNIKDSWTWNKPVRFLPVHRPGLEPVNVSNNIIPPQRALTPDDYHPFLHLGTILRRTFAEAGYTLRSQFIDGELFDSLYISGNYPTKDVSNIRSRVDFKAGRTTTATAAADYMGRVFATPYENLNSIGNIVDTIDPQRSTEGITAGDVFSNGGYFHTHEQGHVEFKPPIRVTTAFEYNIAYRTQYRVDMATGTVKGFDRIYIGNDNEYRFNLRLPFPDHKAGVLRENHGYRVFVYGHSAGDTYQLEYLEVTNPNADLENLTATDYVKKKTSLLSTLPMSASTGIYPRVQLRALVQKAGTTGFTEIPESDWAIYDSSMALTGTMNVEVRLRTQAFEVTPVNPKTFHDIYFGGANPGMTISLMPGTTLRPIFTYGATEGAVVDFKSVAAHDNVSCLDIVRACKQMFNIYFFTDQRAGVVYAEPRDDFYRALPVADLSARIDLSRPVTVSDPAGEAARTMTFCYAPGDEAVGEYNRIAAQNIGVWSMAVNSKLAAEGEKRYTNPLFAPSVNSKGAYSRAVAASLLRVGSSEDTGETNFPMKIVRYTGMKALPAGQTWGWPGEQAQYPLLAFHEPSENISLAFESRDGQPGLHGYWDTTIAMFGNGRRVQLYIDMQADDIESLVCPDDIRPDFRAQYRLTLDGESALYRLEEVADYNPTAKRSCTFIKEGMPTPD